MAGSSPAPPARRRWPWTLAALALAWALLTALAWDLPLNNDVAWQYWVARQLNGGARFYIDIAESNPPLWFWEAMPLGRAADALAIAPAHAAVAAVIARIVLAAGLIGALSDRRAGSGRAVAVLLLVALGAFGFGERDHLMAIGALPYALLVARRAERRPVAPLLAIAIALLAGWGFAMKPHFLLLPAALEGWLALRRGWRPVRPETATLAALGVGYAAAILLWTPAYLTHQLPVVLSAYGDFKPPFAQLWSHQAYAPCWLLGALAVAVAPRRRHPPCKARASAITPRR